MKNSLKETGCEVVAWN